MALAACGDTADESPATSPSPAAEPDEVTYLTAFGLTGHDAFALVADEKGFFADHGLDVTIEPGAGNRNLTDLAAGQAQFTYVDFTGLLIQLGNGAFTEDDFRGLSMVHQNSLVAVIAPEASGITAPADLEGKRVGSLTGAITQLLLPVFADSTGFDLDSVEIVNTDPQGLPGLLVSGQVDALSTFIFQEHNLARLTGGDVAVFSFAEYLPDLVGTGIITTGELAEEDPDLVQRFRDAIMEGLRYTNEHPEEAVEILKRHNPTGDEQHMLEEITLGVPLIMPDDGSYGIIDQERTAQTVQHLADFELIPADAEIDLETVFDFEYRPAG